MKRYETLVNFRRKRVDEEQAAEILGLTVRDFRFRLTKYGDKLPIVLKTMDRIQEEEISREEAAHILGVTVRQVNNLMKSWSAERPLKEYLINRAISTVKWEIRKKFAIEVIAGTSTYESAAEQAEISERQIRRWVSDLLDKHFGMVPKDLKELTMQRRARLADEIEASEGLEMAKISVLNEVAKGQRAIEEVALERVLAKRANKGKRVVRRNGSGRHK